MAKHKCNDECEQPCNDAVDLKTLTKEQLRTYRQIQRDDRKRERHERFFQLMKQRLPELLKTKAYFDKVFLPRLFPLIGRKLEVCNQAYSKTMTIAGFASGMRSSDFQLATTPDGEPLLTLYAIGFDEKDRPIVWAMDSTPAILYEADQLNTLGSAQKRMAALAEELFNQLTFFDPWTRKRIELNPETK